MNKAKLDEAIQKMVKKELLKEGVLTGVKNNCSNIEMYAKKIKEFLISIENGENESTDVPTLVEDVKKCFDTLRKLYLDIKSMEG